MAKTPSQVGLAKATTPPMAGGVLPSATSQAADLMHEGTTDLYNPEWGKFFDMLNAAAPGGITNRAGMPGQQTEAPFGSVMDKLSPTYNPQFDPTSPAFLGAVPAAQAMAKGKK